jgi:serine protease AprX
MKRQLGLVVFACITVVMVSSKVLAPTPKASGYLGKISPFVMKMADKKSGQKFSVLVTLEKQANLAAVNEAKSKQAKAQLVYSTLADTARTSQAPLVSWLNENKIDFKQFYIVNMVALYNVDFGVVKAIAKRDDVARVVANPVTKSLPKIYVDKRPSFGSKGVEASIASTGATRVWEQYNAYGEGIVVAGQDTGVEWDHPALKNSYRGWDGASADHSYSWHDSIRERMNDSEENRCGINLSVPCDDHDHGSHTMGTIVGDDGKGNQIGMAPKAKWIACRNMDAGMGQPSSYIECFEWFLAPYPQGGDPMRDGDPTKAPHVINNSWGCPESEGCQEAETLPVLEKLKAAGIMIVASAGNDGPGCGTIQDPPAMHTDFVLSVGAHNHANGQIASFSSRGPSKFDGKVGPNVTAPGVNIRSSVTGGKYTGFMWSGTSMAGPHVVGEVALLWSAVPSLIGKIEETKQVIMDTATAKTGTQTCGDVAGDAMPNNIYGHGNINVLKAVEAKI